MSDVVSPRKHPDSALSVQLRLIVALVLRGLVSEIGTTWTGVVAMLFRPAMIVVLFYILYSFSHRLTPQGMPLLAFLVTGWLAWFMFMRTFTLASPKGSSALLLFPHMTPLDLLIAHAVLQWFIYTFVFLLFVGAALLIERSAPPANPLYVIMAFWSVSVIGSLLAVIFSSVARVAPVIEISMVPLRRLGAFATGILVTAADTPSAVLPYLSWNPLLHAVELMREAWWPAYVSPIADPWYVLRCIFWMAVVSLVLERSTRKYIKS
jgi:capsular polysaccharide transport system permease protein